MVSTFEPSERSERAYSLMETLRMIVTQTLEPKIGGGRVGLREWLVFTDDIREKLLGMPFDTWSAEVIDLVRRDGRPMEESARQAYERGDIEKRHYMKYTQSVKHDDPETHVIGSEAALDPH